MRITNSNGQDMVFFAKVYDIAPDGSETLVTGQGSTFTVPGR